MIIASNVKETTGMENFINVAIILGPYLLISFVLVMVMDAYNQSTRNYRDTIKEGWFILTALLWPIVPLLVLGYVIIQKGFLQNYLYIKPRNKISKMFRDRREKREAKHRFTDEEMNVVNDLNGRR